MAEAWSKTVNLAQRENWQGSATLTLSEDGVAAIIVGITSPTGSRSHQQTATISTPNMARDLAHELEELANRLEQAGD